MALFWAATWTAIGDGLSTSYWTDKWLVGCSIDQLEPSVVSAVPRSRRKRSVASAENHNGVQDITGAVTVQLLMEYLQLWDMLDNVQLSAGVPDSVLWRWTSYSVASAYGAMFIGSIRPIGAKQIWKTSAPPKVKFFFWLVLRKHKRC